jgi:ABC-type branched-subunit amino acid transport system ATPase component
VNEPALGVTGLTVRFGGLTAVSNISFDVSEGEVVGLIGPNGAGKTTTFNACSGFVRPTTGAVRLFGVDVTRIGPEARAQRGLGRTFQRMELFDRLKVSQNVAMGREAVLTGTRRFGILRSTAAERRDVGAASAAAMERCGVTHLAERRAGALSSGQRRMVELARALAAGFRILLLDEPSSGLDSNETEAFGEIVQRAVDGEGIGVLLVEHDMSLVRSVCERAYVLDFGQLIDEGPIGAVLSSDKVRAAYLGAGVVG